VLHAHGVPLKRGKTTIEELISLDPVKVEVLVPEVGDRDAFVVRRSCGSPRPALRP